MAILIDENTRALIQGGTGAVGSFQTKIMLDYGTNVVVAVTPGKGGQEVHGIPVYDFVQESIDQWQPNAAFSFVPARFVVDAAIETIDAGLSLLVITAEGVPDRDMMTIIQHASRHGTTVLGPDTPGLISPGRCKLGVHPNRMFARGNVGVLSKSGALSYEVCKTLTERSIGQSTVVGIGGGPLWGLHQLAILQMFEEDPQTKAIALLGEVGGTMELEAAAYIQKHMEKPIVAMIVGSAAPPGAQMGHAGAIIEGEEETASHKIDALKSAGALIAHRPQEIADILEGLGVLDI